MHVSKQSVAQRLAAYLRHDLSLAELVNWAESALMDEELDLAEAATVAQVLARLGVADVRAFGLSWEDCESLLRDLGYTARIEVVAA